MDEGTRSEILKCRAWRDQLYEAAHGFARSIGPSTYMTDLLAVAALNRAMCLLRAFCDLTEKENSVAAAPLARLQLDTSLRLAALDLGRLSHANLRNRDRYSHGGAEHDHE